MTHYWFISKTGYRQTYLALFTCTLALVVILLGAYTRLTNAGLSCPDWPNCYGYVTAPHTASQLETAMKRYPAAPVDVKKAWTEMTHRYFAGTEGIFILALAISFLRKKNTAGGYYRPKTAMILLGLLGIQVMLGMFTVTAKLKPVIVLAHLLTGLSLLSLLWWTFLNLRKHPSISKTYPAQINLTPILLFGLIIVATQITLGGWVSTHYAGLACIDLPYCNNAIIPDMKWHLLNSDLITIHMLHRIGAMVTAVYLAFITIMLWPRPTFKANARLILALLALQLTLGVLNILWLLPVSVALLHHAVAILILLTLIATLAKAKNQAREGG